MTRAAVASLTAILMLAPVAAWSQDVGAPASTPGPSAAETPAAPSAVEPAPAAPSSGAMAAIRQTGCLASAARASDVQISRFLEEPASLLMNYGMTSLELSALVRSLVGSDTRTIDPVIATLAVASVDQRAAIGAGLGRAAFVCQEVNPDYAAQIQSKVADLQLSDVKTAFLAATNDIQVAAIAGGGAASGAGAPGLSGGGVAGPGTAGAGGDDTVATTSVTYTIGNGAGFSYLEGTGGESSFALIAGSPASVD